MRSTAAVHPASTLLAGPMALLMTVGFLLPGLLMLAIALGSPLGEVSFKGLSLDKFTELSRSAYFWRVLTFTVGVSALIAVINAVLAYPLSLFLARSTSRWVGVCYLITFTPLAVGMNMLTIGWLIMLGQSGVVNGTLMAMGVIDAPIGLAYGFGAVIVGLAHISFTFMVLPLESVIRNIPMSLERAAVSLGASRWRAFLTITLPLSFEGIAAGMLIVFMQSCGAFVIPLLLGGSDTVMLPVAIWEQMSVANDRAGAAALSIALTSVALVVLVLQLKFFTRLPAPERT